MTKSTLTAKLTKRSTVKKPVSQIALRRQLRQTLKTLNEELAVLLVQSGETLESIRALSKK